jgi:phage gpG-like protein
MTEISITGLDALRAKLDRLHERTTNLKPAFKRAGVVALDAFKERIEVGGPGWVPNKSGTPLLRKTGRLFNSFSIGASGDVFDLGADEVTVGTNVAYASYLNFGTRGRAAHRAEGKLAGMLGGSGFFSHSGATVGAIPARPLVFIDEKLATLVHDAFAAYILGKTR